MFADLGGVAQTNDEMIPFLIRAHALVVSSVPNQGAREKQPINVSPSISLHSSL